MKQKHTVDFKVDERVPHLSSCSYWSFYPVSSWDSPSLCNFRAAFVNNEYYQSMSFQQFISCNKRNLGCEGGNLQVGSLYAVLNSFGGISRLNDYEYTDYGGTTTESCDLLETATPLAVEVSNPSVVGGLSSPATFNERLELFKQALMEKPVAMVIKSSCAVRMLCDWFFLDFGEYVHSMTVRSDH